jgi:hypothetical protein
MTQRNAVNRSYSVGSRSKRRHDLSSEPRGSLTLWEDKDEQGKDDHYYEFVGDGELTGEDVIDAVITQEAKRQPQDKKKPSIFHILQSNNDAKKMCCQQAAPFLFDKPKEPIPVGKIETLELSALLKILTPGLEDYRRQQELRTEIIHQKVATQGEKYYKAISHVSLEIPIK